MHYLSPVFGASVRAAAAACLLCTSVGCVQRTGAGGHGPHAADGGGGARQTTHADVDTVSGSGTDGSPSGTSGSTGGASSPDDGSGAQAGAGKSSNVAGLGGSSGAAAGSTALGQPGFVHPGLLLTRDDIARMKVKIASKADPYFSSYTALIDDAESSATASVQTPAVIIGRNSASQYASTRYAAETAAVIAFQNALLYALAGEAAHAAKCVAVLDAYATTTKHFDAQDPERDLEAAILGWLWVSAAELIRYSGYGAWPAGDVSRFNAWIRDVVYADTAYSAGGVLVRPLVNGAGARGAFGLRTKLAIGVYLDDQGIYAEAIDYFFHGKGNGAPSYYIDTKTGQTWEAGRDQGHAQGGLSRLIETAQIAYNQGDPSLYAWRDVALARSVEYIAAYNLGNDVPYSPMQPYTTDWADVYDTISAQGRGQLATIYELPYAYFHSVLGMNMPNAKQALAREGAEVFSAQNDNPMFATLSYRR
jgi:hypothetical protein